MADALQQAIALHQQGDWHEAEKAYRAVLSSDLRHADALALLGSVLSELKKHGEAVRLIQSAIALDPQTPLFHFHLGNAFDKAGLFNEAEMAFATATAIAPQWAQGWYNLGNAQRAQNKNDKATASYERALRLEPQHALASNNLAMLHHKKGETAAARQRIAEALKVHPDHPALLLNFSGLALEANDFTTAFDAARRLAQAKLGIAPGDTSYLSQPGFFRGHDEEGFNTLLTLATSTLLQGRLEEASAILRGMLSEEPDMAEALMSLGNLALVQNKFGASEDAYSAAFMLNPSDPTAPWNRSMVHLTRGDMREGFRRYRWRWHALDKHKNIRLSKPAWEGENLKGKTLLIHEEQGFGDTLQMLRYLPALKGMGATVYFYAQPPLVPLLEGWCMIDKVLPYTLKDKTVPPEVDYVCGVMDLPGLFDTGAKTIPAKIPYLPNPKAHDPALKIEGTKKKIGLVWAGNPSHKRDFERSIPFENFRPLLEGVDADFFSLQYRPKEADQKLLNEWNITDLSPRVKNLADMAALLSQLDLLITIDSAPAHLAGGLGVPTFLLITHNPDWRWLMNRDDSPWYPRLRLFRQPCAQDWPGALDALKSALPGQIAEKAH